MASAYQLQCFKVRRDLCHCINTLASFTSSEPEATSNWCKEIRKQIMIIQLHGEVSLVQFDLFSYKSKRIKFFVVVQLCIFFGKI